MRIAVVHNAVHGDSAPDELDVLVQAQAVSDALVQAGHAVTRMACTLDLADARRRLAALRPEAVFNLVESLDGSGRLIHLFPTLLDSMGLRYTGSGATAIMATSHKTWAKAIMTAAGLPTPPWVGPHPEEPVGRGGPPPGAAGAGAWIVKSLWEHASVGLDESRLALYDSPEAAHAALPAHAPRMGGSCFAEAFIDGREFNLSLLAGAQGPEVLPPAEILFDGLPKGSPRIVGYRAKWVPGSPEYDRTPRRFDFPAADGPLLARLQELARACWRTFGLRGYARVDFRVDDGGRPWILEVNANPCISPDAGFAAALQTAGISYQSAVERILADIP